MSGTVPVSSAAQWSVSQRLCALKGILLKADVARALRLTGQDKSFCAVMPSWLVVWFVVGLGLFHRDSYRQVFRHLIRNCIAPLRTTLCEARQRVGARPLALLCKSSIRLLAKTTTPGAFYAGMRLMAIDAFTTDVYDSPANDRAFGRPGSGRGRSAFPQVRTLSLCEAGTHVFWRSVIGKYSVGESRMAPHLIAHLQPDMLLLWDKNFFKYDHIKAVQKRSANLLARVKTGLILKPIRRLSDGSYLAKVYRKAWARDHDLNGLLVRVIDYKLDEPARKNHDQPQRIITTLLDPVAHPAATLVELYHVRWEEELAIDELKTHQMIKPLLKSQTPAGVIQEILGLLLAHYCLRTLMFEAAEKKSLSPTRISFVGTLNILEIRLPQCPQKTAGRQKWRNDLVEEISCEVLPPRRNRINPRVIKRKMSKWRKKAPPNQPCPQPTKTFRQSVVIIG
jgi:Transposase DDE domain/Insertion element 4 transposase N-terminal